MNAESPLRPGMPYVEGPGVVRAYAIQEHPPKLRPARQERAWMDAFPDRHAYRCLPLNIANSHGWEILCPVPIEIEWNGGLSVDDLTVRAEKPLPEDRPLDWFCRSNFSRGIFTFHTDYIFRTPPGWDMVATGPVNEPKDNAYALTGVIETDWLPYTFSMNWQTLKPGKVRFEEGEPFCFVYPIPKQALIATEMEIHRLQDDEELFQHHEMFRIERDEFLKRVRAGDQQSIKQAWQRHYFVGRYPDGTRVEGHLNKLRVKDPVDRRGPFVPRPAAPASEPETRPVADGCPVDHAALAAARRPADDGCPVDHVALAAARRPVAPSVMGAGTVGADDVRRDPRWEEGGPLDWIRDEQTILNLAGRARIDAEGVLHPSPFTRRIASAADAAGDDFLCVEELMGESDCARVVAAFEALRDLVVREDDTDPYWNDRYLWGSDILRERPEAGRAMVEASRRARALVEGFYRLKAPIYNDLLQLVQWRPGKFMRPHADRANPDGSAHGMAHRDFGGILYLNDDYEGGEIYLTALDIAIKPRRGMFVAFTGGFHHEHGVARVKSGAIRLTMPTFYTFDPSKAEPSLHPGIAAAVHAREPQPA